MRVNKASILVAVCMGQSIQGKPNSKSIMVKFCLCGSIKHSLLVGIINVRSSQTFMEKFYPSYR